MKRIVIVVLLLSACGTEGVQQAHIDKATELCSANEGVKLITEASASAEVESCGFRCSKESGKVIYTARVSCKNGALFLMKEKK